MAGVDNEELERRLAHARGQAPPGSRWRHVRTGSHYRVVSVGLREADCEPVVIYRTETLYTGLLWVRPLSEWAGRFVRAEEGP